MRVVKAPAKLNLALHVLGRRPDGYHELDTMVVFVPEMADFISLEPAEKFSFSTTGPYATSLSEEEKKGGLHAPNLICKAVRFLNERVAIDTSFHLTLTKNIPLGAGLGGGSADAAAALRLVLYSKGKELRDFDLKISDLAQIGADVPMCYAGKTAFARGVGEKIMPCELSAPLPLVLVCPLEHASTSEIFHHLDLDAVSGPILKGTAASKKEYDADFLKTLKNDLTDAAIKTCPVVQDVLNALDQTEGCRFSRMTGSGTACWGIFNSIGDAEKAAEKLSQETSWLCRAVWVGP